jgi:hypothetical protein
MISAIEIFIKGVILGLAVSIPLGLIGIILVSYFLSRFKKKIRLMEWYG